MKTIDHAVPPRLLWTSREAATALSISERTLWGLTKRNLIPCVRIGRSVRYAVTDIQRWVEARRTTSPDPETRAELP
jgi:excisionase family DNA binding protein